MSKLYTLPRRDAVIAQAAEWMALLDAGLSAEQQQELHEWLCANPVHRETLAKIAGLWDKMGSLASLGDLFPHPQQRRRARVKLRFAFAASLLMALVAGLWVLRGDDLTRSGLTSGREVAIAANHFETNIGEHSTIVLPDGSQLTLNTNSRTRTDFNADQRTVYLEQGEVHVQVAHDKFRPFKVYVGDHIVQAVGTAFNVEISDDQKVELIVTEGKVLVAVQDSSWESMELAQKTASTSRASQPPLAVEAGQELLLDGKEQRVEEITPEEMEVKLSWRGGNLIFRGESLAQAIDEIERYTAVEFEIRDESLKQVRVAGLFRAGDVDALLETLKENFNVSYQRVSERKVILNSMEGSGKE